MDLTQQTRAAVVAWAMVRGIALDAPTAARFTGLTRPRAEAMVQRVGRFLARYETGEARPGSPCERAAALVAMMARGRPIRMAEAAVEIGLSRQGAYWLAWRISAVAPVRNERGRWWVD